ncbi:NAD(P)-binding protein [Coprinellus micaceus]|uniref:NAD(P)-binding protein n=1 Tax=Coprinellus micaceus TaxID=71717 RepID=A0A4Y7SG89_COPMI|nr:NAD(P)-binding protein [Coprinellus micaceus]
MGAFMSVMKDAFPPKPTFKVDDIPDLRGKVVIVTGANTGVGKETARALLVHNAKVYVAARNQSKAQEAIEELRKETGKEAIFLKLDLGDLNSIKASAEEFMSKGENLNILFNNAGVMRPPVKDLTSQDYDLQFGTNVLGHFYFTKLLIPALTKGAKSSPDGTSRVVTTSSSASFLGSIDFNALKDSAKRRKHSSADLYSQSKLGNVLISNEFAERYGNLGIISIAVNPGNLNSELARHMPGWQASLLRATMLYPVPLGALTQLYAGTMDDGAKLNGKWMRPWARHGEHPSRLAHDKQLAEQVWQWCEDQVANL